MSQEEIQVNEETAPEVTVESTPAQPVEEPKEISIVEIINTPEPEKVTKKSGPRNWF